MWTHLDKREKRALRSTNFIEASYSKPEQHLSFTQKFGDNVSATGTQTKVLGITEECWLIKICILFRKTSYWEIRSKDRSQPYPHKNVDQNFGTVFSVNLVCKKELNLMLKVSETSSQGAVGFELRGTDFFLPILYDPNNK